jgi:hypothetical protein
MQAKVLFFLNFVLKFIYEIPNHTAANRATINRTMQRQTKARIAKSSCVKKTENTA